MHEPSCENCAAIDARLFRVHRKYVTPASWDTEASERVLDEIERWCFSCCTQYPHEPAG